MCHVNTHVEFEFWSGRIIFGKVMPLGLIKNSISFQFPLIISITNRHLELKFIIKICHENTHVEFEFGSGRIIFCRVMPLGLIKIQLIFSFPSLFPLQIDILN